MATFFVSDLHLSCTLPRQVELFRAFLSGPAREAEALYILGDLFEVWVGDDDRSAPVPEVLDSLAALSKSSVPLFVMRGNRDFLLGRGFEKATGCRLLKDPTVIDLYGQPALLMHGDSLCTRDREHQLFRTLVNSATIQKVFLAMSLDKRMAAGAWTRNKSKQRSRGKTVAIMDVEQKTVEKRMHRYGVDLLIHGHTHRPAIHTFQLDGSNARRIVLGDWYEKDSVLVCDESGQYLRRVEELASGQTLATAANQ